MRTISPWTSDSHLPLVPAMASVGGCAGWFAGRLALRLRYSYDGSVSLETSLDRVLAFPWQAPRSFDLSAQTLGPAAFGALAMFLAGLQLRRHASVQHRPLSRTRGLVVSLGWLLAVGVLAPLLLVLINPAFFGGALDIWGWFCSAATTWAIAFPALALLLQVSQRLQAPRHGSILQGIDRSRFAFFALAGVVLVPWWLSRRPGHTLFIVGFLGLACLAMAMQLAVVRRQLAALDRLQLGASAGHLDDLAGVSLQVDVGSGDGVSLLGSNNGAGYRRHAGTRAAIQGLAGAARDTTRTQQDAWLGVAILFGVHFALLTWRTLG